MSSIGLSGLSNISNDTLQGRYEKALKQINKLIEINRELKEKVGEYEKHMVGYEQEIQRLEKTSRELDEENNILDSKYMELSAHMQELEDYCKKLEEEIQHNQEERMDLEEQLRSNDRKYHEEMEAEMGKFAEVAREAEYYQRSYEDSVTTIHAQETQLKLLQQQLQELQRENSELKELNGKLNEVLTDKHITKMQSQLDQANKNIDRLMNECNQLKARQIDFQVIEEKQKVERYIGLGNSINEQQGDAVNQIIQQYKRKIKESDAEKKEWEQKYRSLKAKVAKSHGNEVYQKKIDSLQRLTEKQQREIAKIIETYDCQLNAVHKENVKVREAYWALSQTLSRQGFELGEKERAISQLKATTDRFNFQLQSLKKMNSSLLEEKQSKFKEQSLLKNQIQNTESITIGQFRSTSDPNEDQPANIKLKVSEVRNVMHTSSAFAKQPPPYITTSFSTKDQQKIPIKVSYPTDKGDFKFIQSVNIINGYNVSLGENSNRPGP